jgi:predicted  nucleic acid-binding Zn-ribbon protein
VSSPVRPDAKAFMELDALVRNLGEELSRFRKRAHAAEARLKASSNKGGGDAHADERVAKLEAENALLRQRLEAASARARKMLDRVRFLRQQHTGETR